MNSNPTVKRRLQTSRTASLSGYSFRRRALAMTLVELVIAIALMASGLTALLTLFEKTSARTSDSLLRQQSLIIAQGFMEEIRLQVFLDPSVDPGINPTVNSALSVPCASTPPISRNLFDDVCDYNNYSEAGIKQFTNLVLVPGLENYQMISTVTPTAFAGLTTQQAVEVTVTVTDPAGNNITLKSFRSRY